jgi:hypothetical protein
MIRRTFIKRFSAGVLGCGMLADALLSRGPTMMVAETDMPVASARFIPEHRRIDVGPRVRNRDDMEHKFERGHGVLYVNGLPDYG